MLKKILIGLGIVGVIAVVFLGYATNKVANEMLAEKEPQLRQYMQLDRAAQDKFILDNCTELFAGVDVDKDGKPEDKEQWEKFKQANTDPKIQKALIDVGRSVMSVAIMASEPIVKDMNADVKAQYQKESDEFDARMEYYSKLLEAAGIKID